jgi:lysozyme family protein
MVDLARLSRANAQRFAAAKITRPNAFADAAKRLTSGEAKTHFQAAEAATGVPWYVIAVIKEREAGADPNWRLGIAQGDPWSIRSIHVPRGRGPFPGWLEAARDALVSCPPYAGRWKDWSTGGLLTLLEQYNGTGYAMRGLPSPYIWSGTDQYRSGKYVRDGVFRADVIDVQLGCAGLLLAMSQIDPTVHLSVALAGPADEQSQLIARLAPGLVTTVAGVPLS